MNGSPLISQHTPPLKLVYSVLVWLIVMPLHSLASPLDEMVAFLNDPDTIKKNLYAQPFMEEPLTAQQAAQAKQTLLKSFQNNATSKWPQRHQQIKQRQIQLNEITIPFDVKTFGKKPKNGYSLYISLHGGGETTPDANDQQWKNQQTRYTPPEGKYVTPRASTDTWNMWFKPHMYEFYDRLIEGMILFEEVDPNRVYIMGYSAGGDGVYQIAPIMADRFAAASMSAGHPNNSVPINLRNLTFLINIGEEDNKHKRYMAAQRFIQQLEALAKADPQGYRHRANIHKGKGHSINDRDTVMRLNSIRRFPLPNKIAWRQGDVLRKQFYWLGVDLKGIKPGDRINASFDKDTNSVTIDTKISTAATLYLNDEMMNLDEPVQVVLNGTAYRPQQAKRTLNNLIDSYLERFDPNHMFSAKIRLLTK